MACEPRGYAICFIYPSGQIACSGPDPEYIAPYTQHRWEVTCTGCRIAMKEHSEFCWRCNQPDPNQQGNQHMRHTCDPGTGFGPHIAVMVDGRIL